MRLPLQRLIPKCGLKSRRGARCVVAELRDLLYGLMLRFDGTLYLWVAAGRHLPFAPYGSRRNTDEALERPAECGIGLVAQAAGQLAQRCVLLHQLLKLC